MNELVGRIALIALSCASIGVSGACQITVNKSGGSGGAGSTGSSPTTSGNSSAGSGTSGATVDCFGKTCSGATSYCCAPKQGAFCTKDGDACCTGDNCTQVLGYACDDAKDCPASVCCMGAVGFTFCSDSLDACVSGSGGLGGAIVCRPGETCPGNAMCVPVGSKENLFICQ